MLLQKAFFRKKNVKIYIIIISALFSVILLLNSYKKYFDRLSSEFMNEHTISVIYTNKDNSSLIENDERINFYQRIINFEEENDNTIILNPPRASNGNVEKGDYSSLLYWDNLEFNDKILVFPASYINKSLEDNEAILVTSDYDAKEEFIDNYIGENIKFNYNSKKIILKIQEVMKPNSISYVCISDNLYSKLLEEEENYIYYVELKEYSYLEDIQEEWKEQINNNKITIESYSYFKDEELNMSENYQNIINILKIANIITIVIFYLIIIITIKNLVMDEYKDIILLKQIGYNKIQNTLNFLKNIILFDLIAIFISIVIYTLIVVAFNLIFDFELGIFNYLFILLLIAPILMIELLFCLRKTPEKI